MRNLFKSILFSNKKFQQAAISCCANQSLLPHVIAKTSTKKIREILFLSSIEHKTQLNQDIFALIVNEFKSGFFIEIGANDGFDLSNTFYLENNYSWDGILIEANPKYESSLRRRKAKSIIIAVSDEEGELEFCTAGLYGGLTKSLDPTHTAFTQKSDIIKVKTKSLNSILVENNVPEKIDFISIDVEGAEVSIVEQMCALKKYRFTCGCIEHNYRVEDYKKIMTLLKENEYSVVWENATMQDMFFVDNGILAR